MEVIFKMQRKEGKTVNKRENNANMLDFQVLMRKNQAQRSTDKQFVQ